MCCSNLTEIQIQQAKALFKKKKKKQRGHGRIHIQKEQGFRAKQHDSARALLKILRDLQREQKKVENNANGLETLAEQKEVEHNASSLETLAEQKEVEHNASGLETLAEQKEVEHNASGLETLADDGRKDDPMQLVSVAEGRFTCCKCNEKRPEAGLSPAKLDNQTQYCLTDAPSSRSTYSTRQKVKSFLRNLGRRLADETYRTFVEVLAKFLCSVICSGFRTIVCFECCVLILEKWFPNGAGINGQTPT